MEPTSVKEIDLKPIAGKMYMNFNREWREEFIYFLLIDRFHDEKSRKPNTSGTERSNGIQTPDNAFYGGKIKGITQNLDYIAGLGCTAIWVSPVFENNPGAYHGYNINNYLNIDPNFGTKNDLIELVDKAHNYIKDGKPFPMRIILDVVINHSGDNWEYDGGGKDYNNDNRFNFGYWRRNDRPIPTELRNPDYYHCKGNMNNYDSYPENQHGDMCGLKDYSNDDDSEGNTLLDILIKAHCYWIKETDIDGFRVDAVKHMGELACSKFSSTIREYAYSLGKKGFFLFGELATPNDDAVNRYVGQNTSRLDGNKTVFFGLDSILDFRLAEGIYGDTHNSPLRNVIKGFSGPETLFNRYEAQRQRALNRGEIGKYLVTFVDNHDSFWQSSGRISCGAPDEQVIASIGYLLCSLGTACIYYGTEQGFSGSGGDNNIREAMFDKNKSTINLLNTNCRIYSEISKIANVMRAKEALRFGRMYFREISGDGIHFGLPFGYTYTLAFSRVLYGSEVLVAYNVSDTSRNDYIVVDSTIHQANRNMTFLYGGTGNINVNEAPNGTLSVRLDLKPRQFVILE
ncbi:MAG: alpha-amylase [Nitrospirae bacterium]|nr:alpha-amylase [Nitrospirota bacterium]